MTYEDLDKHIEANRDPDWWVKAWLEWFDSQKTQTIISFVYIIVEWISNC